MIVCAAGDENVYRAGSAGRGQAVFGPHLLIGWRTRGEGNRDRHRLAGNAGSRGRAGTCGPSAQRGRRQHAGEREPPYVLQTGHPFYATALLAYAAVTDQFAVEDRRHLAGRLRPGIPPT